MPTPSSAFSSSWLAHIACVLKFEPLVKSYVMDTYTSLLEEASSDGLPWEEIFQEFAAGSPWDAGALLKTEVPPPVDFSNSNDSINSVSIRPEGDRDYAHAIAVDSGPVFSAQRKNSAGAGQYKKNAAQRRFYQRRKDNMSQLQAEVKAKMAELERLGYENSALQLKVDVLEHTVSNRDEQLEILRKHLGVSPKSDALKQLPDPLALPSCDTKTFERMTVEDLKKVWKIYTAEASQTLLLMDSDSEQLMLDNLKRLRMRLGCVMKHVHVLTPEPLVNKAIASNLEFHEGMIADDAHWASVVGALDLSDRQITDIVACYQLFHSRTLKLVAERKLIKLALSHTADKGDWESHLLSNEYVQERTMFTKLLNNIDRERVEQTMLYCFVYSKVLTPVQHAKLNINSHPFWPDLVAIAQLLAQGRS